MSWGVLEGEGRVCGVFDKEELRQVLPESPYTRQGRDVRAAEGDRPPAGYCRLSSEAADDVLVVMVEAPAASVAAQQWANSDWPKTPMEHPSGSGSYGYRGPESQATMTGAAVVETPEYVAAVFLDHLGEGVDGAELARDLLVTVLDDVGGASGSTG